MYTGRKKEKMEFAVLYDYLKNQKVARKNWSNILKTIGLLKLTLLIIMLVSGLCSAVMLFVNPKITNPILIISILVELLSVIVLNIVGQKENILNSKEGIEKLDLKFDEIKDWLASIGYVDKREIKQLCNRCTQTILRNKENNDHFKRFIDKLFTFFLIPIFVASISWILGLDTSVPEHIPERIALAITIGLFGMISYILIFGLVEFFQPIIDSDYEKMSRMVKNIQGMLDRKFPIEDSDIV